MESPESTTGWSSSRSPFFRGYGFDGAFGSDVENPSPRSDDSGVGFSRGRPSAATRFDLVRNSESPESDDAGYGTSYGSALSPRAVNSQRYNDDRDVADLMVRLRWAISENFAAAW